MQAYDKNLLINLTTYGAGDGSRTRNPQLGRLMLCQLSYSRLALMVRHLIARWGRQINSENPWPEEARNGPWRDSVVSRYNHTEWATFARSGPAFAEASLRQGCRSDKHLDPAAPFFLYCRAAGVVVLICRHLPAHQELIPPP